jgi:membrane associated rhomboid family serine protease
MNLDSNWWTPTVGASGAVFGLFAALVVMNRKLGVSSAGVFVLIGINAFLGFTVPNIAWQAHLGGLVTGAVAATLLIFAPKERRALVQWAGLAGVLVLLAIVSVVKFGTVPADVKDAAAFYISQGPG